MSSKNTQLVELPQQANALEKANRNISSSTNKMLYILVVEDPTAKEKYRLFATTKIDKMAGFSDVIGYEITNAQSSKLKTWDDATALAEKQELEVVSFSFPWHRVISIRNVSYKSKSA